MPASGGASDKLCNRYEALWAIDGLLRIVDGTARLLIPEPLDSDESKGIEFVVGNTDGTSEHWSVKRQTTKAAGWTLAVLTAKDDRGRSILGDLLTHVERAPNHRAVFASALGAREFDELREHAATEEHLKARLARSGALRTQFHKYVLPLCGDDMERALVFLLRTQTHAAGETHLRDNVKFKIRKLFYAVNGTSLDDVAVRGYLSDLLLESIHRPIDREAILSGLESHGVRLQEWAVDQTVRDRINSICEAYTAQLRSQRINGILLPLVDSEEILNADGKPLSRKILVVGGAGSGKSTTLASVVERLVVGSDVPALAIRFDQLPEGILDTEDLGRKLKLPESPALVLAGVAAGSSSVLVIDQLDAVSIASGRRIELWALFEELCREVERSPGMSLIVGCREFDLTHDYRMRSMVADTSDFQIVTLRPLTLEQVDAVLERAGVELAIIKSTLKPLLVSPLNLSLFLRSAATGGLSASNLDELFDIFWVEGERRTDNRLGCKAEWTQVIDKLTDWLSAHQQLSAPEYVLDDHRSCASAMTSEHVLVLADARYRFFHESFFDYAFARRFAARGDRLVDLLLRSEQHLFRRAQVRQVLTFLRPRDWPRYLEEFKQLLTNGDIRFHIKRLVFQWLSSLPEPKRDEWNVLQKLLVSSPDLRTDVRSVIAGRLEWFDVVDAAGFFEVALSSGDEIREQDASFLLGLQPILGSRSDRVAELLREHRRPGDKWAKYLRRLCRTGDVYHSRRMFDIFLLLIDDGTFDDVCPEGKENGDWWSMLRSMSEDRPDLTCEAIGHWLDRVFAFWRGEQDGSSDILQNESLESYSGAGVLVIHNAAKSAQSYVRHILPRIAAIVEQTARECGSRLWVDGIWSFRSFGMPTQEIKGVLLSCMASSLETLASSQPSELDRWLEPYQERPHDTIVYLVLRAWTAAPEVYADRLAEYLVADPRRLEVGYATWPGRGGSAANFVSAQAVKEASSRCSLGRFKKLEHAILSHTEEWEVSHPNLRGLSQLEMLRALDCSRLSKTGRSKLDELERKFPEVKDDPPRALSIGATIIGPPVPEAASSKMTDEQWLKALLKYTGVFLLDGRGGLAGGERELGWLLMRQATAEPVRFSALAERMTDDLPGSYFDAIVRGVAESFSANSAASQAIGLDQVVSLLRRVHALPQRPCGISIALLIEKWVGQNWPGEVIDLVAWYAVNDPDPEVEVWTSVAPGGQLYHGGDPYSAGINSTRGSIAGAIARLLLDEPNRFERLCDAVDQLAHDRSIAVRSCAIKPLLAVLNVKAEKAVSWFAECVAADSIILETPHVERFIHYAGYDDYTVARPVIQSILASTSQNAVGIAARQVCLLALAVDEAEEDAVRVRRGTPIMRKAAAEIYSANVASDAFGPLSRRLLKPFFSDPDDTVRAEAAHAFQDLAKLGTSDQADLLAAFLDGSPAKSSLNLVVRVLEDSPVQLPDLVCAFAEACIEAYRDEEGKISNAGAVERDLSKTVIRLYAQTEDRDIRSRCLNLIDEMERYQFMGMYEELQRLGR